jgi:hypothetical protein
MAEAEDITCTRAAVAMDQVQEACRCLPGYVRHEGACIVPGQCRKYTIKMLFIRGLKLYNFSCMSWSI